MGLHIMQVAALSIGAIVTGVMYGSNIYLSNRVLFAGNVFFTVWNCIGLIVRMQDQLH